MPELPLPHEALLRRVGAVADGLGLEAYAVGGVVRDAILGRPVVDVDVMTLGAGSGVALARAVAEALGGLTANVYPAFGTAAVRLPAQPGEETVVLEFVGARRESYRADSRKPVVEDGTLAEDLARRDFTVNALAVSLNAARFGELVDPGGGLADLAARRLRTPLDPAQTFSDDPLRMMRAARFSAQLAFDVDEAAVEAMTAMADRIGIVSQERVTDELVKTVAAPYPARGLKLLFVTGLLEHVLPELARLAGVETVGNHRHKDNFYHTLEVLENVVATQNAAGLDGERATGRDLWLRWAAILHDIAKPETKRFVPGTGWTFHGHDERGARRVPKVFRRLKLPLGEPALLVEKLVRLHHRPTALVDAEVTESAVRRLLFDAGDDVGLLMTLVRADVTSKNPQRVRRYLAGFDRVDAKMDEVEARDQVRNFQPPVRGEEIMAALGVEEGLAVGLLKERLKEAILDGEVANEHAAAWAFVQHHAPDALRRGRLFDRLRRELPPADRRALGALREALATAPLPEDEDAAWAALMQIKTEAMANPESRRRTDEGA